MKRKREIVVFDWNGTLLEDTLHCLRATNAVLELLGREPVTIERYRKHCRVPIAHMYNDFGVSMEDLARHKAVIHEIWNGVYNSHAQTARLRGGAESALCSLGHKSRRAIILSNHTTANISEHIRRFGIHDSFEAVLAYEQHGAAFLKNVKGERMARYIEEHGIDRGIIVGDTEEEIEIARTHGFVAVAVTGGVCSTERLLNAKPDFIIDDLEAVPGIAEEVFGREKRRA